MSGGLAHSFRFECILCLSFSFRQNGFLQKCENDTACRKTRVLLLINHTIWKGTDVEGKQGKEGVSPRMGEVKGTVRVCWKLRAVRLGSARLSPDTVHLCTRPGPLFRACIPAHPPSALDHRATEPGGLCFPKSCGSWVLAGPGCVALVGDGLRGRGKVGYLSLPLCLIQCVCQYFFLLLTPHTHTHTHTNRPYRELEDFTA